MMLFEFAWSDNNSAGNAFVVAATKEEALRHINTRFKGQALDFSLIDTYPPGDVAMVTTDINPM